MFFKDEGAYDQGVEHGHGGRLGGGEEAGGDADKDDEGHPHGDPAPDADVLFLRGGILLFMLGQVEPLGVELDVEHLGARQQQAGKESSVQHGAHGQGHGAGVEDGHVAGRDEGALNGRGGGDGAGKALLIAVLLHGVDLHLAQTGDVGQGRAGDGAEDGAGQHVDVGQSTPPPAHPGDAHKVEELAGDAGPDHDLRRQHEQGQGHQRKGVDAREHADGDDQQVGGVGDKDVEDGRQADGIGDGEPDEDGYDQNQSGDPEFKHPLHLQTADSKSAPLSATYKARRL